MRQTANRRSYMSPVLSGIVSTRRAPLRLVSLSAAPLCSCLLLQVLLLCSYNRNFDPLLQGPAHQCLSSSPVDRGISSFCLSLFSLHTFPPRHDLCWCINVGTTSSTGIFFHLTLHSLHEILITSRFSSQFVF